MQGHDKISLLSVEKCAHLYDDNTAIMLFFNITCITLHVSIAVIDCAEKEFPKEWLQLFFQTVHSMQANKALKRRSY